uniref:Reverse transcriptase domain-containing protein n=1 Tax=Pelodiscus sinensis TaxID=13735 RepID=K7F093_PELSI
MKLSSFSLNSVIVLAFTASFGKEFHRLTTCCVKKNFLLLVLNLLPINFIWCPLDAVLVAHNEDTLQALMDSLSRVSKLFSLDISLKKTVVFAQGVSQPPKVILNDSPLEVVQQFCYLGSTVTTNLSKYEELNITIGKAATTFGRLMKRAWNNPKLTWKTQILIYQACVLSVLLYGSETWTSYSGQEKKLSSFHLRCVCRIMNIKWQDKVSNVDVLSRTGISSFIEILNNRRRWWLGHVRRMSDKCFPKEILFGKLTSGARARGRPKLRFKDICKNTIIRFNINPISWEFKSSDRNTWQQLLQQGTSFFDRTRASHASQKEKVSDS